MNEDTLDNVIHFVEKVYCMRVMESFIDHNEKYIRLGVLFKGKTQKLTISFEQIIKLKLHEERAL